MRFTILLSVLVCSQSWALDTLQNQFSTCSRLEDDEFRLQCYDRLSREVCIDSDAISCASTVPLVTLKPQQHQENSKQEIVQKNTFKSESGRWLGIRPYRKNYILPLSYNSRLDEGHLNKTAKDFEPENIEIKFQISFELPVWQDMLWDDLDLYFAYTQLSFFQAYNTEYSSPFRDTTYEPELGLNWRPERKFMGWHLSSLRIALNHQSNGRSEPLSRSWNRLIGQFRIKRDNLSLGLRLWTRIREDKRDDDNPDILDYMGHEELFAGYDIGRHRLSLMLRNTFNDNSGLQLGWSYLLNERVRLYVQYFHGYGEDLIEYDQLSNRLGIGFLLNEWP